MVVTGLGKIQIFSFPSERRVSVLFTICWTLNNMRFENAFLSEPVSSHSLRHFYILQLIKATCRGWCCPCKYCLSFVWCVLVQEGIPWQWSVSRLTWSWPRSNRSVPCTKPMARLWVWRRCQQVVPHPSPCHSKDYWCKPQCLLIKPKNSFPALMAGGLCQRHVCDFLKPADAWKHICPLQSYWHHSALQ